ncbi:MAG: SsrA-binding protein SmpB [Chthoniobacterales bacterium]|nr:SsrA-binding protein SmpB [Chthoniobacterales bacterium]
MAAEITTNRKAFRDYHILERLEAGVELKGTEVKSLRLGLVSLQGAFARINGSDLCLYEASILPYERASHEQHEAKRVRRLLLHRSEIDRLVGEIERSGRSLVALSMYWKKGRVKVELGLGKGKDAQDKRSDLKKRVAAREMDRAVADFQRRK